MRASTLPRWFAPLGIACFTAILLANHTGESPDCRKEEKIRQLSMDSQRLFTKFGTSQKALDGLEAKTEVDELVFAKMESDAIPINSLCSDGTFIRRASLLLTGRLPDPETTRSFLDSSDVQKRDALIDALLAGDEFETHWAFWFQEMFQSTGQVLRAGRDAYNRFFQEAIHNNTPLDQMARALLLSSGLSHEQGEANFYVRARDQSRLNQDFWDNAAISASTKMLGVPLECISCHNGAYHLENINLYLAERKREDLWGMAAFFSELRMRPGLRSDNGLILSANLTKRRSDGYLAETDSGDRPARVGGLVTPRYMFSGESAGSGQFQNRIADLIVSDRQFARNFANRLWGHLFGLALVEPIDAFDLNRIDPSIPVPEGWTHQVSNYELLEHLTDYLIGSQYDLRAFLRYVTQSTVFAMDSGFSGEWQENYAPYYTRFLARRLSAESIYDNLMAATGLRLGLPQGTLDENGERIITRVYAAHALADTNQPQGRGAADIRTFLDAFGRGNRYDLPRSSAGSISQALQLMNAPLIQVITDGTNSRLATYLRRNMPAEEIVENLFLDFLCREPTSQEQRDFLVQLDGFSTTREKAQTALWLMVNRLDFIFVY